jgi:hypothetical protein
LIYLDNTAIQQTALQSCTEKVPLRDLGKTLAIYWVAFMLIYQDNTAILQMALQSYTEKVPRLDLDSALGHLWVVYQDNTVIHYMVIL